MQPPITQMGVWKNSTVEFSSPKPAAYQNKITSASAIHVALASRLA